MSNPGGAAQWVGTDTAALRVLADKVSSTVEAALLDLSMTLHSAGELLERRPGEITWTLQIQVVGVRVAIVGNGPPHFWVAYFGPPNGDSAPARVTSGLDADELRQALREVMQSVVREGRPG
ncbi:MAG: hypothetical protein JWN35_3840 [Frankiales bacterium]|jgi:hypothetical protein|nr:hypothetical protein [Frankiales bacterium]